MVASVLGESLKPLFEYVALRGLDPAAMVRHFGVELAHFEDPEVWVPVSLTDRIWEHAASLTGDANLALHVAELVMPGKVGALSYMTAYSANFEAALDRLIRFYSLISSHTRYRVEVSGGQAHVTCHYARPCTGRQPEEIGLAVVAHFGRRMCGAGFVALGATFRSGPPPHLEEHEELFGSALTFSAPSTCLVLPTEVLRLPIRSADEQLATLLERAARPTAPWTGGELAGRVRVHIAELLSAGCRAPCEDVASRLGMSPRTLRRHLADAGLSYRQLLDEVLSKLADELLLDGEVSMDDVATRLQFSDVRALSNATRRWFGMTPQQYRRLNAERTPG